MLLSAVSVLVVAQSSSEVPEGLMNNPVYIIKCDIIWCVIMLATKLSDTQRQGVCPITPPRQSGRHYVTTEQAKVGGNGKTRLVFPVHL